ncbi:MAG: tRNA pseudouridine(38-40) synthase TruA [Bacilli bacterium]|nr:tRNA pseudouridine(38-40) synthase TruA [Bacilli bacterium]
MKYFVSFSYDGSCFNGFQRQKKQKTVQGEFEKYLSSLEGNPVELVASGRTDKGVHAKGQCAHFCLDKKVTTYGLKKYLNRSFNGEIYVSSVTVVDDSFHARYDVKDKIYSYYINMGEYNPMMRNYMYQYCKELDIEKMKKASSCLIGEHDFRSFCTDEKGKDNCIRNIYSIDFEKKDNILKITFKGNGFLRKMIRNIMAILIEIGNGSKEVSDMKRILEENNRKGNLKCAFSGGLYLEKVNY